MTAFEDRIHRMAREAMGEIGREESEIADVVEPPGADYCVITFTDPNVKSIEISKPLGMGESQSAMSSSIWSTTSRSCIVLIGFSMYASTRQSRMAALR
jgi:hypothetical protein